MGEMNPRLLMGALAFGAAACAEIPMDPEGTLERVRAQGVFRVGIIAPGAHPRDHDRQRRLIAHVARSTGARPLIGTGSAERLLTAVERGEVDLVIGELAQDSPWSKHVTLLPPLRTPSEGQSKSVPTLHAVARNGENGWIALLHRHAETVAKGGS